MKKNELETIVLEIIESIEQDIDKWKESESLKISDLQTQFSDLLEQLQELDKLQNRLQRILNELNTTSLRLKNL